MKSIVSYPERGFGGKNTYRGNCSPKLVHDLADFLKVHEIADYMCGGGIKQIVGFGRWQRRKDRFKDCSNTITTKPTAAFTKQRTPCILLLYG